MNHKPALRALLIVAIVLGLTALACGSTDKDTSEQDAAPTATKAAQSAPAEDKPTNTPEPEMPGLGGTLVQDDITLTSLQYADPANPGQFYTPEEDTKLVAVELIIGNVDNEPISINPLNATLIDTDGFAYTSELGGGETQIDTLHAHSGERVQGWISFEIPKTATGASIKYQAGTFSGPTLQVGLAEGFTPPAPEYARPACPALGETAEADGHTLSVVQVKDPAEPGQFYTPVEGTKLIAVEVTVGSTSSEQITVNPLNAILVDADGFLYAAELGAHKDGQIDVVDLNKGEKAKGWIAFQVPETASAESVWYTTEGFSAGTLQAGCQ